MKTFQEFLREQARGSGGERQEAKTRWISSVDKLISQMTSWLGNRIPTEF